MLFESELAQDMKEVIGKWRAYTSTTNIRR